MPGWARPRRSSSRPIGPPANPVTPYDPSVAARTMSTIGAAGDERAAGRRIGWHAGDVLLGDGRVGRWSRRRLGAPEAVWYPTAPFGPFRVRDPPSDNP